MRQNIDELVEQASLTPVPQMNPDAMLLEI
jgi:hypothetical protein